jgi:secretion/DNA translocation related TadE-like protein
MTSSLVGAGGRQSAPRTRGSVSLAMAVALAFGAVLATFAVDVSRASAARARAQVAADAAALAAAQELLMATEAEPSGVAARYAEANGARLLECRCPVGSRDAVVTVEVKVTLPLLGQMRTVRATARAVIAAPIGAAGLQPSFVASLNCLFQRVAGLWIVSGFRTEAEQAALFRRKPDLAAPPGHSMHELGLAADVGFPSAAARVEAHRQAPSCGLQFPVPNEPWHVEPA